MAGYFLVWIAFFQLARILFFAYQEFIVGHHPLSYLLGSAWHGFTMDLSMAAYLIAIPCFLMIFTAHNWRWYGKFSAFYHVVVGFCVSLIVATDLPVFQAWKFRLDTTPLHYLSQPAEAFASASSSPLLLLLFLFFLIFSGLVWVFRKTYPKVQAVEPPGRHFFFFHPHGSAHHSHSGWLGHCPYESERGLLFAGSFCQSTGGQCDLEFF